MRKILSSLVLAVFAVFTLMPIEASIAAEEPTIVGFEILAPTTAKANEAIDVTVRAIDKDKKTVTNYKGSIIFISDTFGDTVPSPGKAISFTQEDAGQKKFSKGVIFRSPGKQKIYLADVDNSSDIVGETTVTVEAADSAGTQTSTETVTIVTPVQDSKITTDMVAVSGKTKKNSKVSFILNGKDGGTALTDDGGLFTKTLSGITQDKNLLQVTLLDGSNAVIAKSEEVVFERAVSTTGFYNIVITPSNTLETSTKMSILVEGEPGISTVSASLDGTLLTLSEKEPGKYTTDTVAPSKSGTYPISVTMVNNLGQTFEKKDIASLAVTEPVKPTLNPRFSNLKVTTDGGRVTFTFEVLDTPADLTKFKIAYGESADSLSQEVMTYSTGKIQGTGGVYTWYIDKLAAKVYTFKVFGVRDDSSLIDMLVSEPITATVGGDPIAVASVGAITIEASAEKSILSWDKVACAVSYNVYKISPSGDYTLIQNVKDPTYTLYLQTGSVQRDDFAVKALCEGGVESADFTKVSQVQTGPGATAILVILSGIIGAILLRKRAIR